MTMQSCGQDARLWMEGKDRGCALCLPVVSVSVVKAVEVGCVQPLLVFAGQVLRSSARTLFARAW